jgi:hypothetical protein
VATSGAETCPPCSPGSYQAASEAQLKTLVGGEASEPMDVEYK